MPYCGAAKARRRRRRRWGEPGPPPSIASTNRSLRSWASQAAQSVWLGAFFQPLGRLLLLLGGLGLRLVGLSPGLGPQGAQLLAPALLLGLAFLDQPVVVDDGPQELLLQAEHLVAQAPELVQVNGSE